MAIKLYKSQLEPTSETSNVYDRRQISLSEASSIGNAMKGMLKSGENFYIKHQQIKSENEVLEKKKEVMAGNNQFEGLSSHKLKANNMSDPDKATAYDANEIKKVKDTEHNFTGLFAKKYFNNWINKQAAEDLSTIKANSTKLFIERTRTNELDYLEVLKKKIIFAGSDLERTNAENELATRLESKSKDIFGDKIEDVKKLIQKEIAFYGYKNVSIDKQDEALAAAIKDKRIPNDGEYSIEKLKAAFKTKKSNNNNLNKDNVKKMESALESGIIFDQGEWNAAMAAAVAGGDEKTILKLNNMAEDAETYLQLSTMSISDIENRKNILQEFANKNLREGKGTELKYAKNLEITKKYLAKLKTDLDKDQLVTAHEKGIIVLDEIGFEKMLAPGGKIEDFVDNINHRIAQAKTVGSFYTREVKFFTANEEKQIKAAFNAADTADEITQLSTTLVKAFGVDSDLAFKQLTKDNTVLSTIGGLTIMNNYEPSENVELLAQGFLLSKNEQLKSVYKIKKTDAKYLEKISKYQNVFPDNTDTFNNIIEAADYIYMAQLKNSGKTTDDFDGDDWEKAFFMASGATKQGGFLFNESFGGYDTDTRGNMVHIPPWIETGSFDNVIERMKEDENLWLKASMDGKNAIVGDGALRGEEITMKDIFANDDPYFVSVGNGKYKIAMGEDPTKAGADPEFLMSSEGKYFIININNIKNEILTGMN